ncbi:MAG: hypothetical protein IJZ72_02990 [Oscillospiraceae bacterium]|nr:hypothetical protein [Oscillospiraceae bacterium]
MKKIDLFKLLLITNCCNILVYFFQPNYISLAIIVMSVICVVKLAMKKQVQKSCFGIMLAVWIIKTLIAVPYLVPMLFQLPGAAALIVLLKKPSVKWHRIVLWFTIAAAVASAGIYLVGCYTIIASELSIVFGHGYSTIFSYALSFLLTDFAEWVACFGFPVFAMYLVMKEKSNDNQ